MLLASIIFLSSLSSSHSSLYLARALTIPTPTKPTTITAKMYTTSCSFNDSRWKQLTPISATSSLHACWHIFNVQSKHCSTTRTKDGLSVHAHLQYCVYAMAGTTHKSADTFMELVHISLASHDRHERDAEKLYTVLTTARTTKPRVDSETRQ